MTSGAFSGPGGVSASSGVTIPAVVGAGDISFAGQLTDPIVKVTDKYSYDQMSRDINSLKSRYGSHLQVKTIGTSLDGRSLYEMIIGNPNASRQILIPCRYSRTGIYDTSPRHEAGRTSSGFL